MVDQVGAARLEEVRRFDAAWEADASLRLRAGDADVLGEYDLRGRIAGGEETEMEDAAFTAALADRARGARPFLLADTNDQAARLAGRTRDQLITAGVVDDTTTVELDDGNRAGVGDRIVTRRNDRTTTAGWPVRGQPRRVAGNRHRRRRRPGPNGDAAAAELAARADARASWPHWDMDAAALTAQIEQAERQLRIATLVAQRREHQSRRAQERVDALMTQRDAVPDGRPETAAAERVVATEQVGAARIDELQHALAARPAVRGDRQLSRAAQELAQLINANPMLADGAVPRQQRWGPHRPGSGQ